MNEYPGSNVAVRALGKSCTHFHPRVGCGRSATTTCVMAITPLAFRVLVVVSQLASALKILVTTFLVIQQLADQAATVGGKAAGGIQFNCCAEVRQRQFQFPTE